VNGYIFFTYNRDVHPFELETGNLFDGTVQSIVICRGLERGWTRDMSGKKPGQAGVQGLFGVKKKNYFFWIFLFTYEQFMVEYYVVF